MKLQLNFRKPGNYAFFCPVSKLHLTRSNPVGFVNEVTPYIQRGINSESIIEIKDNDIAGQKVTEPEKKPVKETNSSEENQVTKEETVEEVKEETTTVEETEQTQQEEAPVAEQPKKRGRQKKA